MDVSKCVFFFLSDKKSKFILYMQLSVSLREQGGQSCFSISTDYRFQVDSALFV